jgi:putative endonuclease
MEASPWWVYILRCNDGSLYTGIARDLERRLAQHNGERAGGPRYTRGRRPVALVWSAPAPDRSAASRREAAIKRLSRCDKLTLIAAGDKVPEVGLEV